MAHHDSTDVLTALRAQAWERAKAELRSCLHTFFSKGDTREQFDRLDEEVQKFINKVEEEGLVD